MRVLVTGAAGFLGSRIVRTLLDAGHDVLCLDIAEGYRVGRLEGLAKDTHLITADIRQKSLQQELHDEKIDGIIHMAAISAPRLCEQNPWAAFDTNVNGTLNILKLALEHGVSRVVFASTAQIYGIPPKYLPTDELHPLSFHDTYTTTKIIGEQLCQLFHHDYGLSYAALRLYNGYGPDQSAGFFIPDMMIQAKSGHIDLRGSLTSKDFVFVNDVANAYVKALESQFVGPINIGTGIRTDLIIVARMIAREFAATLSELYDSTVPTSMLCDPSRAKKVLGWKPNVDIFTGIKTTTDWWQIEYEGRKVKGSA